MPLRVSMRGLHVGRCHIPVRHLVVLWFAVVLLSGWFFLATDHQPQSCRHHEMLEYVCRFYSQGTITGKMCPRLCEERDFVYTKCLSRSPENQVYEVEVKDPKSLAHDRFLVHWAHDPKDGDYDRPKEGSSMEDLRHMLSAFLQLRLGETEHADLQSRLLDVADINNDGKVSLAEAKTMWALLRGNKFLLLMALSKSEMIPKLEGFCGDVFVTEGVQEYSLSRQGMGPAFPLGLSSLLSRERLQWTQRAHIVLGVIEFVEEIIDNPLGNFLMCSVTAQSIGYTKAHDAKLLRLEDLYPEVIVEGHLQDRECQVDEDCLYGLNCQTPCGTVNRKCFGEVTYPNLYKMCNLLEPVLFRGVPSAIEEQLRKTFKRCRDLRHSGRKMDMEHSLVINDIKGIIWRQISNAKS
ncbi:divergent protein kinase domain 1B-like [Diadema setosum]|uniref:divergent protein kinase domain 1B-like n=1 Tax=Diadema setosum TaxID=31175 RepID=UPI003B3AD01F